MFTGKNESLRTESEMWVKIVLDKVQFSLIFTKESLLNHNPLPRSYCRRSFLLTYTSVPSPSSTKFLFCFTEFLLIPRKNKFPYLKVRTLTGVPGVTCQWKTFYSWNLYHIKTLLVYGSQSEWTLTWGGEVTEVMVGTLESVQLVEVVSETKT